MIEQLIDLDHNIFFLINYKLQHSVLDFIMPYFRNKYFWSPLYLFLTVYLVMNYKRKGLLAILLIIITIVLSDQISSSIIKPFIHRIRPCNNYVISHYVHLLVPCGSGYSFPSSHAANHFSLAVFISSVFYTNHRWVLPVSLLWAFSIAYAQVYVGVHFPFDITGGAILGIIIGLFTGFIYYKIIQKR